MNAHSVLRKRLETLWLRLCVVVLCCCLVAPEVVLAKGVKVDPKVYLTGQPVGALVWVKRNDGHVLRGKLESVGVDTFSMRANGTFAFSKPKLETLAYADVVEAKRWDPDAIERRYFKVLAVVAIVVSLPIFVLLVELIVSAPKIAL